MFFTILVKYVPNKFASYYIRNYPVYMHGFLAPKVNILYFLTLYFAPVKIGGGMLVSVIIKTKIFFSDNVHF